MTPEDVSVETDVDADTVAVDSETAAPVAAGLKLVMLTAAAGGNDSVPTFSTAGTSPEIPHTRDMDTPISGMYVYRLVVEGQAPLVRTMLLTK